ncbi:MAG: OmpA family protein [bacterium]|nr:OmpA family protein [bacterium]
MKIILLLLLLLAVPSWSLAKVEMKSFYFKSNTSALQPDSQEELEKLKRSMDQFKIQIIELNAFTENTQFNKDDKLLAQKRINSTLRLLEAEDQNLTINNFGNERIQLDFTPYNWERVDIYFVTFEKDDTPNNDYASASNELLQEHPSESSAKSETSVEREVSNQKAQERKEVNHLNLHLNFISGKAKIHPTSKDNLKELHEVLQCNPYLKANIRGHVCCGDNMRISKKRARKVYRYLVKSGIDKKRLDYEGLSNTEPLIYPEVTSHDRRMNRRVEVVFNGYVQL